MVSSEASFAFPLLDELSQNPAPRSHLLKRIIGVLADDSRGESFELCVGRDPSKLIGVVAIEFNTAVSQYGDNALVNRSDVLAGGFSCHIG